MVYDIGHSYFLKVREHVSIFGNELALMVVLDSSLRGKTCKHGRPLKDVMIHRVMAILRLFKQIS